MGTSSETDLHRAELAKRDALIAKRDAVIAEQAEAIAALTEKVAGLQAVVLKQAELLGRNSKNSNLPPSSDGPGGASGGPAKKRKENGDGAARRRGTRARIERSCRPKRSTKKSTCSRRAVRRVGSGCRRRRTLGRGAINTRSSRRSRRRSRSTVATRSAVRAAVTGPRALYDDDIIPRYAFGPRVMSVVVLLTGVYHLSRRDTVRLLFELLGLRISTGSVSNIEKRMSKGGQARLRRGCGRARERHASSTRTARAGFRRA